MASESTHFKHANFSSEIKDLIFKGDTHVPPGKTFLRLTKTDDLEKPQKYSVGSVLHSKPVLFKADTGKLKLTTTIVFAITETAEDKHPADGIAFFIQGSLNLPHGASDGNFGIFEPQSGTVPGLFAVEFDIFKNEWDPTSHHIGIDIESRQSDITDDLDIKLVVGHHVKAVISYEEANNFLDVNITAGTRSFTHQYPYDLSRNLDNEVYVGISSSTGDHVALHDILFWSFDSDIVRD